MEFQYTELFPGKILVTAAADARVLQPAANIHRTDPFARRLAGIGRTIDRFGATPAAIRGKFEGRRIGGIGAVAFALYLYRIGSAGMQIGQHGVISISDNFQPGAVAADDPVTNHPTVRGGLDRPLQVQGSGGSRLQIDYFGRNATADAVKFNRVRPGTSLSALAIRLVLSPGLLIFNGKKLVLALLAQTGETIKATKINMARQEKGASPAGNWKKTFLNEIIETFLIAMVR